MMRKQWVGIGPFLPSDNESWRRLTTCKSAAGDHARARTNVGSAASHRGAAPGRSPGHLRPAGCICLLGRTLASVGSTAAPCATSWHLDPSSGQRGQYALRNVAAGTIPSVRQMPPDPLLKIRIRRHRIPLVPCCVQLRHGLLVMGGVGLTCASAAGPQARPAQTYVPQRAPGALWPSGGWRPLRPVGCMRGLDSAGYRPERPLTE